MTPDKRQPAFPLAPTFAALTLAAAGAYALAFLALPVLFNHPPHARAGISWMALAVWASLVFSVLPVAMLGRWGVMPTVYGYFFGAAARFVSCLVAGALLVKAGGYPAGPVMLTLAAMYVILLFIEVGFVGRYLWAKTAGAAFKAAPTPPAGKETVA